MKGTVGLLVGLVIVALGLAGLGVALAQMMTHADPHGPMLTLGGLAVFGAAWVVMLIMAR